MHGPSPCACIATSASKQRNRARWLRGCRRRSPRATRASRAAPAAAASTGKARTGSTCARCSARCSVHRHDVCLRIAAMKYSRGSVLCLSPGGFHRVAYLDWGPLASDHVVLCVHGLARNSRDFDFLAAELARECRVICPDVVGRGDSEWLADKSDYRFSTYLADAAVLLARVTAPRRSLLSGLFGRWPVFRRAAKRIDWVGTSMGGLIGMLLAAKPGSPIRRLVLNDVGPFVSWGSLYRLKGYVGGGRSFESVAAAESWLREACAPFGRLTDEQWRHLARHSVLKAKPGDYRLRYDPGIGEMLRGHSD